MPARLAAGRLEGLSVALLVAGSLLVPVVWLAVPHARRPWLYRARWPVVALVVALQLHLFRHASIENPGAAYVVGVMLPCAALTTANLVLWRRPQAEAARAVSRPTPTGRVWVWQTFPADESFAARLCWASDLFVSIRGGGWNWAISSIPRPRAPAHVKSGGRIDLSSIPLETACGCKRPLTARGFLRERLTKILATYLLLDLVTVWHQKDPYYLRGPDYISSQQLPEHLRHVPAWCLLLYRETLSLAGIVSAFTLYSSLTDLVSFWLLKHLAPARVGVWQHASLFGSFSCVLDRGLSGWWGGWWHQILRIAFLAPTRHLSRQGYLANGSRRFKAVALLTAFALSGLVHAAGSIMTAAPTKPWRPLVFFLAQAGGIIVQRGLSRAAKTAWPRPPRALARAANLVFTAAFMYATGPYILDDLASTGIFGLETLPVSPMRALGFGRPGDHWWRVK
ncbi:hypothetical protein CDD83_9654 [Cordyceps sp. RAO-2017]|nr:hypothetical protein CDD83_9654 [Cordyceps sp. RAO-2017]